MKQFILFGLICFIQPAKAQELFVFTEPASNMATSGAGVRLNNYFVKESNNTRTDYHLLPELMFGLSKKLMLHGELFFSNSNNKGFAFNGASLYSKYRFYSIDEVHSHLRMAAFGRIGTNNRMVNGEAIDLAGLNSGYETGIIATKLLNKFAFSASASFLHATDNGNDNAFNFGSARRNALGYSISLGKLLLPREYTSYRQTNLNGMLELLGQTNAGSSRGYLDLAPSLQLIINSVARVDIGERINISGKLQRAAPGGTFVRLEYNFFNLFKK